MDVLDTCRDLTDRITCAISTHVVDSHEVDARDTSNVQRGGPCGLPLEGDLAVNFCRTVIKWATPPNCTIRTQIDCKFIQMCVSVCVCVCEREREREIFTLVQTSER